MSVVVLAAACTTPRIAALPGAPASAQRLPSPPVWTGHRRIDFQWELKDQDMTARGDGVARIAYPDSVRLDFFLGGGHGGGAAVLIGIPRADAVLELPALTIPRMERRILGSIYGSTWPERDFAKTFELYRSGRLPLDKLVTHRLTLGDVERAFDLMRTGEAVRVVLDLGGPS